MPATQKLNFKKRSLIREDRPDAPEGEWDVLIPKGKCKPVMTGDDKGNDPGILIQLKLEKAINNEAGETFQGSEIPLRIYYYDKDNSEKRRGANMMLRTATALAEKTNLDLEDLYPDVIESEADLWKIIEKIEGKRFKIWTVHSKNEFNGETRIQVNVRFNKPGAGLVTKEGEDDDEESERPGAKKKANGTNGRARR